MLSLSAFGSRAETFGTHLAAVCGSRLWVSLLVDQVQQLEAGIPDSF